MIRRLLAGAATTICGLFLATNASATDGETGSALTTGSGFFSVLFTGQQLISDSGYYRLTMQGDGNLVEYGGCGTGNVIWANNEAGAGRSAGGVYAAWAILQNDGNFVEYSGVSNFGAIWATNTTTGNGNYLWMQDDGNVVVYEANGGHWATGARGVQPNPHCGETASFTTVWSNWMQSSGSGGTMIESASLNFGQCGNVCAITSNCAGFVSSNNQSYCQLFSSMPDAYTQSGASGDMVGMVTRTTPVGN